VNKIQITSWSGRLGNNLFQLANAFHLAKHVGGEVSLPTDGLIDTMQREFFSREQTPSPHFLARLLPRNMTHKPHLKAVFESIGPFPFQKMYSDGNIQFEAPLEFHSSFDGTCSSFRDLEAHPSIQKSFHSPRLRSIMKSDILPLITRVLDGKKLKNIPSIMGPSALTIHFRSGDVMDMSSKAVGFAQAPASLAKKVISDGAYKKVILCSGGPRNLDEVNPTVREIMTYCANLNIEYDLHYRSVIEDMYILLNSHNVLIMGQTSFSRSLILASPTVENIFMPVFDVSRWEPIISGFTGDKSVQVRTYEFLNYVNSPQWIPTKEVKRRMITHSVEDVILRQII